MRTSALAAVDTSETCSAPSASTSRYFDNDFVAWFVLRQFGPLAQVTRLRAIRPSDRAFERLPQVSGGGESFYQTILSIAGRYIVESSICADIGCGTGRITGELARRAKSVVGLDSSPLMIAAASGIINGQPPGSAQFALNGSSACRIRTPQWGMTNASFVLGSAEQLPFEDRCVDLVTCLNVLHRVVTPRRALAEISRVTRPGGIAVISNSYDWSTEFTPDRSMWFEDVLTQIEPCWELELELDAVPYSAPVNWRKTMTASNHVVVLTKI